MPKLVNKGPYNGPFAIAEPITVTQGPAGAEAWLIVDSYTPTLTADITANDSDKTITVTALRIWQPLTIQVSLISTAVVGNRQMTVLFTDAADNVIARAHAGLVQAASLTYSYTFGLNLSTDFALIGTQANVSLPLCVLPAGYKIRVYDSAAIDAAADDMTVRLMVLERAA